MTTLDSLGFDEFFARGLAALGEPDLVPARVVSEGQSSFGLAGCRATVGDLAGRQRHERHKLERPVVGDWVAVVDEPDRAQIRAVLERRSALMRRAAGTRAEGQIVAVNVDVFFVVTSAKRDLSERRLERYLTAIWNSGAEPAIVLSKIDLEADANAALEAIARVALDVPVLAVSAISGAGVDDLRARIGAGRTVAFVGSSGVGKSTLINRLLGMELQATGDLRADERGRHTTTSRQLVVLPGGGVLIDTPGMRELGLLDDAGGVDASFADVAAFAARCRFRDCAHDSEPGCAVVAAVAAGQLPAERLDSYRKLMREIAAADRARDPAAAQRARARSKVLNKALRARAKLDPKLDR